MSGWSFGLLGPAALLGVLAGGAALTIALYLLRLRRRSVVVSFIELWETLIFDKKAAALRSQLKRWLSLLLSLLLVAALILAWAEPHAPGETRGRHIVVLIDAGSSMSAPIPGALDSCLDVAKRHVDKWFASLGPGDEMLLIELGERPRPLEAFTSEKSRLKSALGRLRALDVSADIGAGLRLGHDVLEGRSAPEIVVVGRADSAHDVAGPKVEDLPPLRMLDLSEQCAPSGPDQFGDDTRIELFSARRYPLSPDRFEVMLNLESDGEQPIEAEISIFAVDDQGGQGPLLEVVRTAIQPGAAQTLSFTNLGRAERGLLAHLRRLDGARERNQTNDWARAVLSARVPVRILLVGPSDTFVEAALLIEEGLIVKHVEADAYPPLGDFDMSIFLGVAPARVARTGAALYLGVPQDAGARSQFPVAVGDELSMFGFDTWDKNSRVFQLIDPYDVQVLSGFELVPQGSDRVLGRSQGHPILVEGQRDEGRFIALAFEPQNSDFVLRPAWPLFVINAIDELFPRGRGDTLATGVAGSEMRVPVLDENEATAVLRGPLAPSKAPTEVRVPVLHGSAVISSQQAGFYDVATASGSVRIAVAAPRDRAHVAKQGGEKPQTSDKTEKLGPYPVTAPQNMDPKTHFDPWFWLVLAVLVVSYVEWWTYHRRWTV